MIQTCRHVLVTPYTSAWVGGPDHERIPHHGRIVWGNQPQDRFPAALRSVPATTYQEHYLYGGPLKHHFGHVMVDTIIRLWAFDRDRHEGVVFPCLDMPEPPAWFYDIVRYFGVERAHVLVVTKPSMFSTLDFAVPGSTLKNGPAAWYLEWLQSLTTRLVRDVAGGKLYFGRRHIIRKGSLMGESYFSDLLEHNGFSSVRPEAFTIDAQRSMLATAGHVVFLEGSSIYSMELLARTGARLFMIPRRASSAPLFAPHLLPKCPIFSILGEQRSVTRRPNRDGNIRPNSPSYIGQPHTVVRDMFKFGLIGNPAFDPHAFAEAEQADTDRYFS